MLQLHFSVTPRISCQNITQFTSTPDATTTTMMSHEELAQIIAAYRCLSGISSTSFKPSNPYNLKSGVSEYLLNNPPNIPLKQPPLGPMHQTQAHTVPWASMRNSLVMQNKMRVSLATKHHASHHQCTECCGPQMWCNSCWHHHGGKSVPQQ